ncbi:unnamed protein product [Callosobruchus maculatus]|uniref:Bromodomain associated domain-containing protein n=2 Tax=Callosobruchus maculatus TaxID=64391 RepID=A0A653DIP7_CALMS|nr:unnamed protein product [Callosobruchus maculatus]
MSSKHWGEIEELENDTIPDITADIQRSMDKCCLEKFDDDCDKEHTEHIILPPQDSQVLYTISLHKYVDNMTEMIRVAELATEMNVKPAEDAVPPMPIKIKKECSHKRNSLNYVPKDFTPFSCGLDTEYPELSEAIVKDLLAKSIATLFVHIGYETTHQSVLDLLVDIVEQFFKTICLKITKSVEDEDKGNISSFPNIVEKVLTETGLGGIRGLNDYYQNRIVKYATVMEARCKDLIDHYSTMLIPRNDSGCDNKIRIKGEDASEVIEVYNPEGHFTLDSDTQVLESALQLLNLLVTNKLETFFKDSFINIKTKDIYMSYHHRCNSQTSCSGSNSSRQHRPGYNFGSKS